MNVHTGQVSVRRSYVYRRFFLVIGLLLILLAMSAVSGWFLRVSLEDASSGVMYLTLMRPGKIPQGYGFDVSGGSLFKLVEGNSRALFHSVSPSGRYVSFIDGVERDMYAYLLNTENMSKVQFTDAATDFALVRDMDVSDQGEVLFVARDNEFADEPLLAKTNTWSIYVASATKKPERLTYGTQPVWADGHSFFFFKNDGVYLFDIVTRSEVLVWKSISDVYSNARLEISPNGAMLAWSAPDAAKVSLFSVKRSKNGSVTLERAGEIPVHAFWAVFSPDSKTIAVQAVNWEYLDVDPQPRIEFYSVETKGRVRESFSLEGFDQERMFITDWSREKVI